MFGYMTDLATVDLGTEDLVTVSVSGHDLHSLLYNFLDELLFQFSTELLICKEVRVTHLDRDTFTITAVGYEQERERERDLLRQPSLLRIGRHLHSKGEVFQARTKHPQGTEVKAITYSNMQIHETPERVDIYVILDI